MRIIIIALITILLSIFVLDPVGFYVYNKTGGKGETDCMIQYINKYYPNGCEYTIKMDGETYPHIDKCGMENEYMENLGKVKGCNMITNTWANVPYCYYTLMFENIGKKLKKKI